MSRTLKEESCRRPYIGVAVQEMETCWLSSVGPQGQALNDPDAALAEDRRGERSGKGAVVIASGGDQEDVPEALGRGDPVGRALLRRRNSETASKPGVLASPSGSAWRIPVCWPGGARRRGGVSLVCGSCTEREKASVDSGRPGLRSVRRAARGSVSTAETGGIEYQSRRSLADRLVLAVKPLLAGVVVERRGRLTRNVHVVQPGPRGSGRKRR